ncbi:hypothetical protein [Gloeocapsopsis dulcis]|nr:hypothetical protein [Gloeocapsopsis dulcis]
MPAIITGFLGSRKSQSRHVLQLSDQQSNLKENRSEPQNKKGDRPSCENQSVFIRRNLNVEDIKAQLVACIAI